MEQDFEDLMDWQDGFGHKPWYFPKVLVLSKSPGTFQKSRYFPKVEVLSKSPGTYLNLCSWQKEGKS